MRQNIVEIFSVLVFDRQNFLKSYRCKNFILKFYISKILWPPQNRQHKIFVKWQMTAKMKGKIRKENKNWIAEDTKQTKKANWCKFCAFYGSDVKPYAAEKSDGKKERVFLRWHWCRKKAYTKNPIGYANFKIVYTILRWKQTVFVFYFCIIFQETGMTSLTAGVFQKILKYAIVFLYTKYQNPAKCL